jgi:hypothetical protein
MPWSQSVTGQGRKSAPSVERMERVRNSLGIAGAKQDKVFETRRNPYVGCTSIAELGRDLSSERPWAARQRLLVLAVVGVVLGGGSVALVYGLTRTSAVNVTVTDGSIVGVIKGNLTAISAVNPLISYFNATTYANRSGYPSSILAMQAQTTTYYHGPAPGYAWTELTITVVGRFTSDLRPSSIAFAGNQTGTAMDLLQFQSGKQAGTNVSFDPGQTFGIWGNGSWSAKATFVNETGAGTFYDFVYSVGYVSYVYLGSDYFGSDHFAGFRVTVEGPFTPPVGVGILVAIINA